MTLDPAAWLAAVREGVTAAAPRAGVFANAVTALLDTGSTNDDVARLAWSGAPEGTTVIARLQSAGRGRRGATWHSPAGGLYLSSLLRPDCWPSLQSDATSPASSLITLMAGVAVAQAVRDVSLTAVELKWPNDVMVRPRSGEGWRKLAGILAEGASDGQTMRSVVLGIGINLTAVPEAPGDVRVRMISLSEAAGMPVSLADMLRALLVRLRAGRDALADGAEAMIRAQWLALAPSANGTSVDWEQDGRVRHGVTSGIDQRGALQVRLADAIVAVHGGAVRWQPDAQEVS